MKKYYLFVTLCLFSLNLWSQDFKNLSLQDAIQHAIQFNRELKNADLSNQQTKKRAWEILTVGLPKINAGLDYSYYIIEPVQPAITRTFNSGPTVEAWQYLTGQGLAFGDSGLYKIFSKQTGSTKKNDNPFILSHNATASITLSQLIIDGRYFIGLQARKKLMEVAEQQKQLTEKTLIYDVKKAYYSALIAGESVNVLEENMVVLQKLLNDTREVYKSGFAEELDVEKLELNLNKLQNQIQKSRLQYENAIAFLKFKIGMDFGQKVKLTDELSGLRSKLVERTTNTFSPDTRLEYKMLKNREVLQGYDAKQKFSSAFPSLVSFLNFGYSAQTDNFKEMFTGKTFDNLNVWNPQGIFGLKLNIPVYDFGGNRASIQQSKLEMKKAENDRLNFEQASMLQLQVAQNNFNNALVEEVSNKRSMELSEKIFNKSRIMFKEGIGNSFNLTLAETDFTTSKINYKLAIYNLLISRVDLDSALGE